MPRAPKPCGHSGCSTKVRGRTYCDEHTPEQWSGGHGSTRAGRTLREQVLQEEPFCACGSPSTEAGHIVPRAYGGKYTRVNLKGQCRPCNLAQIVTDRDAFS
jgi:5-methylcytosine-specific restriction endonuclease McrA